MTKTLDQLLFSFYTKNDRLRITDLHQGVVWGTKTNQAGTDDPGQPVRLDGEYGTVLNRFLMQAAIGHPLTVHGTGGQTRAFIHIREPSGASVRAQQPARSGAKVIILNQITETHRVVDLADHGDMTGTEIAYLPNPRREADENELTVRNDQFLALGLQPTTLSEGLLEEIAGGRRQVPAPGRAGVDFAVGVAGRDGDVGRPHDRGARPALTRWRPPGRHLRHEASISLPLAPTTYQSAPNAFTPWPWSLPGLVSPRK